MLKSLLSAFSHALYAAVKLQRRRHKQISSGNTNHNTFLVIFAAIALKREKKWPNFFKLCPSFQYVNATDDSKLLNID